MSKKSVKFLLTIFLLFQFANSYCAKPLWTFTVAPGSETTQVLPVNSSVFVTYIVQNQTNKFRSLEILPTPGVTQNLPCRLAPKGQPNDTCLLNLLIDASALPPQGLKGGPKLCQISNGAPNPLQCYQPSMGDTLNITVDTAVSASIIAIPPVVIIPVEGTQTITIFNRLLSTAPALNLTATLPDGITLVNTTCQNLPVGGNCTFTFTSDVPGGPLPIVIKGDNTNTLTLPAVVTSEAVLSITSPAANDRLVPVNDPNGLVLEITNTATTVGAIATNVFLTTSGCSAAPNIAGNCQAIQPTGTCNFTITSDDPFLPCTIQVHGTNVANSVSTPIASTIASNIVVAISGSIAKVLTPSTVENGIFWDSSTACLASLSGCQDIPNAISYDDGPSNTTNIIAALQNNPGVQPGNYAASRCTQVGQGGWYLPAVNELFAANQILCPNALTTNQCNFGNYAPGSYWSSSQSWTEFGSVPSSAWIVNFPYTPCCGLFGQAKNESYPLVCMLRVNL